MSTFIAANVWLAFGVGEGVVRVVSLRIDFRIGRFVGELSFVGEPEGRAVMVVEDIVLWVEWYAPLGPVYQNHRNQVTCMLERDRFLASGKWCNAVSTREWSTTAGLGHDLSQLSANAISIQSMRWR